MSYSIAPLSGAHDRKAFDCGVEPLNVYLQRQASQDMRRKVSACFVAVDDNSQEFAGYYTLSAASVPLTDLPDDVVKKLPRYVSVPTARLGRLAVATPHHGKGLGGALLFDALARSIRSELMAFAMIVDAKDAAAVAFYKHHGFLTFGDNPRTPFLPLSVAEKILKS